ncbi:KAP family P-loop NTPase fold protein [Sphingomonas sp. GB1N7]|uniref:KAP family P-loop NTPase fold protein n=1 Tax=Parasphingomonas caseinilytica TaxID=3096158 RepID=UPI002FCC30A3
MTNDPWANDKLNRKADGEHLIAVLIDRYGSRKAQGTGSYILNIDASWGEGKTFFLECLRADLQQRGHLVASVNAWRDDHSDDPLITIMAAIEETLKPILPEQSQGATAFQSAKQKLGIVALETVKQVGFHTLKTFTGIAVEKTIDRLRESGALTAGTKLDEDAFDKGAEKVWDKALEELVDDRIIEHQSANASIDQFKAKTAEALSYVFDQGMKAPMFVFVDELDRCRPPYAIKLLENLKHLFEIDGIVFIVATDSAQLSHSVKAIYGNDFESKKYLRRFFDRVFVFPEANKTNFVSALFVDAGIDTEKVFYSLSGVSPIYSITKWATESRLSHRDIVQIMDIVSTFVTSFEHKCMIEVNYLLGLAGAFYASDEGLFMALCGTKSPDSYGENWQIKMYSSDISRGQRLSNKSAIKQLHTMAQSIANNSLVKLSESSSTSYGQYFNYEMMTLYNGNYQLNAEPNSVLLEYPSRVKNAGRVIDRQGDK